MRLPKVALTGYVVLSVALWPVPLLNVLHVESAAVIALAAFFIAGLSAIRRFKDGASALPVLAEQAAALLVPLAALTLARLWAPNCAYLTGLGMYVLFPGITCVLAVGAAYALTGEEGWTHRRASWILSAAGVAIVVAGPIYDLGFHPQFYTYNHVFGGVLGPIYDEQLAVRPGLFVFRGLTLLWAGALFAWGHRRRQEGRAASLAGLAAGLCGLGLLGIYAFSASVGINTTPAALQHALSGHRQTAHVDLYYDPSSMSAREAEALVQDHEAEIRRLTRELQLTEEAAPGRIQSYIYPSPDVKAQLTGARATSVSPVWLAEPQVHLLRSRVEESLSHELAHVFSRPFGLPGINASWAVGLVEGWSVALEAPSGQPSAHDLVAVAAATDTTARWPKALEQRAQDLADRLSPWGFWTGRGAVSYATMGSFVTYLLDTYGPGPLKRVYATANFRAVYGQPLSKLAGAWAEFLRRRPVVSVAAHDVMSRQFARPSLFETRCPHYVPSYRREWQAARRALSMGDTTRARSRLQASLAAEPGFLRAHVDLARLRLAAGTPEAARQQLDTLAAPLRAPAVTYALADAEALRGHPAGARSLYAETRNRLPRHDHEGRTRVALRDAVAEWPDLLEILTGPDSSAVQARRLMAWSRADPSAGFRPPAAVQAWIALRWQEAYRFEAAHTAWTTLFPESGGRPWDDEDGGLMGEARPPAWSRSSRLQLQMWAAEAALRSGRADRARRLAEEAAATYRRLGDEETARRAELWAARATWAARGR